MRWVPFALILTGVALAPNAHATREGRLCSLVPFATGRDTALTFFIGHAQPRTVLAGPGTIRYQVASGHWGTPTASQAINGQVVLVERIGGAGASRIEAAFAGAAAREVVVVPWDYDPACQPVPWARTGQWVTSTDPGFYRVRLRPESLWVEGRPVLDAMYGDLEPYPHGVLVRLEARRDASRTLQSLTPAEYFDLYAAVPEFGQLSRDPGVAAARLDAWERAHPETARKYPAPGVLRSARWLLNRR